MTDAEPAQVAGAAIPQSGVVKNITGTAVIYVAVGGDVTEEDGYPWEAAEGPFSFDLRPGERLHMIVESGGAAQTLRLLRSSS